MVVDPRLVPGLGLTSPASLATPSSPSPGDESVSVASLQQFGELLSSFHQRFTRLEAENEEEIKAELKALHSENSDLKADNKRLAERVDILEDGNKMLIGEERSVSSWIATFETS
jgi:hypothetical protein